MIYWKQYDIVVVERYNLTFVGILDELPRTTFRYGYGKYRHTGNMSRDYRCIIWPVVFNRQEYLCTCLNERCANFGLIIENKTLNKKIMTIQKYWRQFSTLRNAAALKIQSTFRYCIASPYHPMGKRRLLREFAEMYE